ncbi:RPC3 polymerase, partial [Polypterus senegalus]
MDIVIVLDGSNSIYPWYEVQNFLSNILSKFHISPEQMQVGVLQYGEISVHEWSLQDYKTTQDVVEAAKNISRQEGRETRTAYAIHMGCTEAFSPERGARDGATKVMIVVTDGESHDGEELPEALSECEKRNITRYAIAWPLSTRNPWGRTARGKEKPRRQPQCPGHPSSSGLNDSKVSPPEGCCRLHSVRCIHCEPSHPQERTPIGDSARTSRSKGNAGQKPEDLREKKKKERKSSDQPLNSDKPPDKMVSPCTVTMVLGHYIRRQQDPETFINEIKYIASDPDEKYFFNVTDEAALNDIVDALGDRIFSLEGTLGYNESSFEMEMSETGFSTHILEDGILFGTVGAYDWDGGVLKEGHQGRIVPPREAFEKEFPLELKNHAAYLGYTVSSVTVRNGKRLYVAGAPRFKHKGKVILFDLKNNGNVTISQALNGEQIGSYYGSELCPIDVDGNGITDVLLVAAPMFLGSGNRETGRVYVYTLSRVLFTFNGTLQAHKKVQDARFGYSLAAAPDLNHDGYNDLVVGAPLEDNHRGAIYIYHGHRTSILPQYKQRIPGSALSPGLQYFGSSVNGQLDLDGDGLVDLAVGAQGSAVLLSSRSIVTINVSIEFEPHSINVIQKNCQRNNRDSACISAKACFSVSSRSPVIQTVRFALNVTANLDDRKFVTRAIFDENSQKQIQKVMQVQSNAMTCHTLPFHVIDTADYIRPIGFTLRFRINDTDAGPVLDEGWPTSVKKFIPFFKDCGDDDICVSDLVLQATMDISGTSDSVEKEETLHDNSVPLLVFVRYEPDLFVISEANLNRYEVHPSKTASEGIGPEFETTFKTTTLNCSLESNKAVLQEVQKEAQPVHPEDMMFTDNLNCSNSLCTVVNCQIDQLQKGQFAIAQVTRRVHDDFFRQANFRSVKIISTYMLQVKDAALITLGQSNQWREVKKALCVLIQHNICSYEVNRRGQVEYAVDFIRVLRLLRFPRYIYTAKTLYGDTGELIVEELLQHGKMTMSSTVRKVADRLTDSTEGKTMEYSEVVNTFTCLVDTHFLQRCPVVSEVEKSEALPPVAPTMFNPEKEMYTVPRVNLTGRGKRSRSSDENDNDHKVKKPRLNSTNKETPEDDGIYWKVNFERFHQYFRDQAIITAVANKLDQTSSEIVRTMLRMSEVTTPPNAAHTQPLSSNEIFRALPSGYNISKQVLDQYLTLLVDDPCFCCRFGSRSARIFRLLLRKRHLEQKQVEDFAMIPAKEAKDMLYTMLSENLVSLQEIPKTPDHAPSRTFYLYTVSLLPTARMLLHRCYKTVANLIERRLFETKENKRLLEKSQRIEAIIASMQVTGAEETQLQEVEEMITAPERQQLETLKQNVNKCPSEGSAEAEDKPKDFRITGAGEDTGRTTAIPER